MPQNEEQEYFGAADDALSLLTGTPGGEGDLARGVTREGAISAMGEEYARRSAEAAQPAKVEPAPNTTEATAAITETTRTESPAASAVLAPEAVIQPTANATAETGKEAEAPGGNAEVSPSTGEPAYDPNQVVVLSDGTRTTLGQLEHGAILKPRYDARVSELQKKERDLDAKKKVVDGNLDYLNAVADDPFAIVYTTALKAGASREAALKAALEASPDLMSQVAPKKEEGPPVPGTERYYLTGYDKLGIDPGTPLYDEWYAGNVETRSKVAIREERAAIRKDIEDTLKTIKPSASPEDEHDREVRKEFHESNMSVLNGAIPALVLEIAKIDVNALSQGERTEFLSVMTKAFEAKNFMINDREWMEKNVLSETDVENVVLRAKDELHRLHATSASRPTAQSAAAPAVQPQLVRPQLEKSVTTISPLPAGDAQVPASPMYSRDDAHQNVEDALNLLHA